MDGTVNFAPGVVALVTGAASGIGLATVHRLAGAGVAKFALVDRDPDLEARLSGLGGDRLSFVTDVGDESSWERIDGEVRSRHGGIDLCVVVAGVAGAGEIAGLEFAEWRRVLSTNLDGAFLSLRAAMRLIRPGGAVVVVASAAGLKAEPGIGAYAASKAGLIQLARVAAKESAPQRVRVNAIAPGGVETPLWHGVPMFEELRARTGDDHKAFDEMAALATPLGRFATADEIAGQIAFLLSDAAATITGAVLSSDGGYTL